LASIRACGGVVAGTDIYVAHSGSDRTPEGEARKLARDMRLLQMENTERPNHPFTLFNLGMTYLELRQPAEARIHLEKSLELAGPYESHRRKTYSLLVESAVRVDDAAAVARYLDAGLSEFPDDPELHFRAGVQAQLAGKFDMAIEHLTRAMEVPSTGFF